MERALDLLRLRAARHQRMTQTEWVGLKKSAFREFYKQPFLYSAEWIRKNPLPAHATGFQGVLESNITSRLPRFVEKISYYFNKKIPGEFLEIRAFPSSVFNLRPEKIIHGHREDRTPFPIYLKDWVDTEYNCHILYRRDGDGSLIYPFNPHGYVPGQELTEYTGWRPY